MPKLILHVPSAAAAFLCTLLIFNIHIAFCTPTESPAPFLNESNEDIHIRARKVEDILTEQEMMESETSRRIMLMHKRYISYETLKRDIVPCDKPGASYYNCPTGQANPYSRGCEVISGCRGGIRDIKN